MSDPLDATLAIDIDEQLGLGSLADRYLLPPMRVLSRRDGRWISRRRQWDSTGIRSRAGRDAGLIFAATGGSAVTQMHHAYSDGTSTFDPVLAEILLRWFSAPGDRILDPFAGGSVRGVVSGVLGRHYVGIDIRPDQVEANREQARIAGEMEPAWIAGDAVHLDDCLDTADGGFDMILTCPPYHDLERYSDDPCDLSTMTWGDFCSAQREAIRQAVSRLASDRFVAWVTSDVRDPRTGEYRDLPGETVAAFRDAGCTLWNELVIVDQIGTSALRAERPFRATRKVTRTHQIALIFASGDGSRAGKRIDESTEVPA